MAAAVGTGVVARSGADRHHVHRAGTYGYAYVAAGVAVALLARSARMRWLIVALAAIVPVYINLRYFDVWTRDWLIEQDVIKDLGKTFSLRTRISDEDQVLAALYPLRMAFGTGVNYWHHALVAPLMRVRIGDGLWFKLVFSGGFLGLSLHYVAMHLPPGRARADATAGAV